jgi:hypothetical protein
MKAARLRVAGGQYGPLLCCNRYEWDGLTINKKVRFRRTNPFEKREPNISQRESPAAAERVRRQLQLIRSQHPFSLGMDLAWRRISRPGRGESVGLMISPDLPQGSARKCRQMRRYGEDTSVFWPRLTGV